MYLYLNNHALAKTKQRKVMLVIEKSTPSNSTTEMNASLSSEELIVQKIKNKNSQTQRERRRTACTDSSPTS